MQGISRLKSAIERHKENKDINIRFKTPLTGKRPTRTLPPTTTPANEDKVRNINTKDDEQRVEDACNPLQYSREVLISKWLRELSRVSMSGHTLNSTALT